MKRNAGVWVLILLMLFAILGFVDRENPPPRGTPDNSTPGLPRDARVYVMIENRGAAFEMAVFRVEVGGTVINETNRPVLVYEGKPGSVTLWIKGEAKNWNGVPFAVTGSVFLMTEPGKSYLVTLEPIHESGAFLMAPNPKLSGALGEDVPSSLLLDDGAFLERALRELNASEELEKNRQLREKYLRLWRETGNLSYLQACRDLEYPLKNIALLAKLGRLDGNALRVYLLNMKATDYYYSHYTEPGRKDMILVFANESPYYGAIRVTDGPIRSQLPFIYYTARGFNLYPVSALHWAHVYFERGRYDVFLRILNELLPFAEYGKYNDTDYAVFPVYFHFQNSSVPWVSGYAQGMAAGLYALAYNITGNETYLNASKLFLNSFGLPLNENGFVARTEYGPWYLEYNYYPDELVLNGHIIALQGLYYHWKVTGDERAKRLFFEGAESVERALPDFDTGKWSRYASIYDSSSEFYHRLHIRLLVWLYVKTGEEIFLEYAEKWNGYLEKKGLEPENLEDLIQKVRNAP